MAGDSPLPTAVDAPRLSIGELFDARAAQAAVERLVGVINAQAAALDRLTRRVASLETTQRHAVAAQQHALQQTDHVVAQLERLQEGQARESVVRARQQTRVDELVLVVSRDAKSLEAALGRVTRLEVAVDVAVKNIRDEMAPMALVSRLQDDQHVLHDRVAAMDARLDAKLDKSELSRLDGVVAKIQAFAPTASQLTTRVEQFEEASDVLTNRLDAETKRMDELAQESKQIQSELDRKVNTAMWREFTQTVINVQLDRLENDVKTTSATVEELLRRGVSLETSNRTLSSKLTSISTAVAIELETLRESISRELQMKLDRNELDATLKEIHHEMSCKAWRKDTQIMVDDLQHMATKLDEIEQQVALSTRFLNWYATRGEAYERNLNVVDTQLERIALASAPHLREPFGDHVRFPR